MFAMFWHILVAHDPAMRYKLALLQAKSMVRCGTTLMGLPMGISRSGCPNSCTATPKEMVFSVFFHIPQLRDTTFYLSALSARSLIFLCFPSILA